MFGSNPMAVDVMLCYIMSMWLMSTCTFGNGFPMAHRPTTGLYLHGFFTHFYCSVKLNLIVACVT